MNKQSEIAPTKNVKDELSEQELENAAGGHHHHHHHGHHEQDANPQDQTGAGAGNVTTGYDVNANRRI